MADIVQSLFGLTPEAYRQQQMNEADRMALGYAQLTPQQRASFGMARAGYQLGGVLGSALGAQDPMLQLISNRQAVAQQIDPTNIESMTAGIQALNQAGDTVGAMQLTQVLRQMQSEMAQRTQREAAAEASLAAARASEAAATRERIPATPADILKAREVASLEQQKAQLVAEGGSPAQIAALDAQLSVLRPQRAAEAAPESVRVAQSIAKLLEERDTLSAAPDQTPQTARKIQIIDAQLAQLQKQEKPVATPSQVNLANAIADAQEQVFALQNQQASPVRDEQLRRATSVLQSLERQLPRELAPKTAAIKEIGLAVNTSKPVFLDENGLFVFDLVDGKQVRTPYSGAIQSKATQVTQTTNVPGQRPVVDVARLRSDVQQTIATPLKTITATDQAIRAINDSIRENNFISFNAARVQLAKALGDSQLSRRDIEQAGGDPSILGGLYDVTSRLFTSTPSIDTQKKIRDTLSAIRSVAAQQANTELDTQRRLVLSTPGIDVNLVNRALDFPQLRTPQTGTPSIADQAREELLRRQAGQQPQQGGR